MDFISRQNVNAEKSHQNCYSGLCYAKPLKIFTVICVQIRVVSSTSDFQRGKDLGGLIPRTSSKEITVLSWWELECHKSWYNMSIYTLRGCYHFKPSFVREILSLYNCVFTVFFFYKLSDGKWYVFMCFWSF